MTSEIVRAWELHLVINTFLSNVENNDNHDFNSTFGKRQY